MADKLKPYDPNKGFISFRLDPDAVKEDFTPATADNLHYYLGDNNRRYEEH